MKYDGCSYSIKNLILYPITPNKKLLINPDTPFSTGKASTNYTNKYINNKNLFHNIYKTFHRDKNINTINNFKTNYYTLLTTPNKISNEFIAKSLRKERKNKKISLLSLIKKPMKKFINKENLIFLTKKEGIKNLHCNLMTKNKISVKLSQEKDLKNFFRNNNKKESITENIKNNNICLTQEEYPLLRKEYNLMDKNKSKEKKIILKEIKYIGKKLSFVNIKKVEDIAKENDINNKHLAKRVKEKETLLEINQVSNFPAIMNDKNLVIDLWKKDMIKFCKLTKNANNKNFVNNLLCVYT